MPPPRAKLYKNKPPPTPLPTVSSSNTPESTTGLTQEQEIQLETELCWCIQQLQLALSSNKLNNKQVQDHTKALNTLMSNTAPLIKKRQVMRLSFGDYRAKMATEEKKAKALLLKVTPSKPNEKSVFLRKAIATSGSTFKFNFPTPTTSNTVTSEEKSMDSINTNEAQLKKSFFSVSDNSFRFNFIKQEKEESC